MQEMDPFDCVRQGDMGYFMEVSLQVLLNSREEDGETLLSRAVMDEKLDCAKLIYKRCPSLLYCESNKYRYNVLHHAAFTRNLEMLKFLIDADASQGSGAEKRLTRMMDICGQTAFMKAVILEKPIEIVKLLHNADPDFIHPPDHKGETLLKACLPRPFSSRLMLPQPSIRETFKLLLELQPAQSKTTMGPNGWTVLHYAAFEGDLHSVTEILQFCPDCSEVVDNTGKNFLHIAAQHEQVEVVRFCTEGEKDLASNVLKRLDNDGNTPLRWAVRWSSIQMIKLLIDAQVEVFKESQKDILWNSIDGNSGSLLSKAVQENDFDLCKMICSKCPSLVYHQSGNGKTPLHHAALIGDAKMVGLLLRAGADMNSENQGEIENQVDYRELVIMVDEQGDTALHIAVSNHELEVAKLLIEADRDVAYNANKAGETPLSIAIREARSNQDKPNTGKIRKLLLKKQTSQSIAPIRDNGWTLLHLAALEDDVNVVKEIIKFRPDYIECVDNQGMNFLHVAAKYGKIQVVKHVLGSKKIPTDSILNMQDKNGNTPLHLAALFGDEKLTLCFLYSQRVKKNTTNNDGQHVLEAINFDYDKTKAGVQGFKDQLDQKDVKDQSDFDLVVGALIATVSFTAGVTVPGGYISDGPNKGTAVLSKEMAFEVFVISNTFALLFSLYAVFSHYCTRRLNDIRYQLKVATYCTLGALYAMMAAFISGSFAVLANSSRLAISVCAIVCCFYIFSICPMWKIVMQERGGSTGGQWRLTCGGWWERLGWGRAVKNPPLSPDNV